MGCGELASNFFVFFFSSRRRHTRLTCDWSSDVCSSDLCGACGHVFWYPRIACPRCHTRNIGWIQSKGRGTLHAFEIGYQSFNKAFTVPPPYVLAMVELAEGPRMLSNLINVEADPRMLRCDMPVEAVFTRLTDEVTLPLFQPVRW